MTVNKFEMMVVTAIEWTPTGELFDTAELTPSGYVNVTRRDGGMLEVTVGDGTDLTTAMVPLSEFIELGREVLKEFDPSPFRSAADIKF